MDIIQWDALLKEPCRFPHGSAVSIGGFDGPHRGHERIFSAVLEAAHIRNIPAGLITFMRSPRQVKQGGAYRGDVSTLRLRLQRFTEYGFTFTVLIDFSEDFATMNGITFFGILMKTIRMRYLAVGSDFTCGYRHDTGVRELQTLAHQKGFCFDSIGQFCLDNVRISSSAVRSAVEQADFALAKDLLGYPFCLDVEKAHQLASAQCIVITIPDRMQIIPKDGSYNVVLNTQSRRSFSGRVQISNESIRIYAAHQESYPAFPADGQKIERILFLE